MRASSLRPPIVALVVLCLQLGVARSASAQQAWWPAPDRGERFGPNRIALDIGVLAASLGYARQLSPRTELGLALSGGAQTGFMFESGELTGDGAMPLFVELLGGAVFIRGDVGARTELEGGVRAAWFHHGEYWRTVPRAAIMHTMKELNRRGVIEAMRRRVDHALRPIPCLALAALLAGCGAYAQPDSPDAAAAADPAAEPIAPGPRPDSLLLTPDGWGPLRIGMSRAEVVAAAGEDAQPDAVGGPEPERCDEFRPRAAPDGVLVMIENDVLTRISVSRNPDIATPTGFRVGDAADDVVAAYGARADVAPHKYVAAPARYITVWRESGPNRRGIRYEVDADGAVAFLRAGGPSIEYVEGCL